MEANNTRQDALELTDSDEENESHSDELSALRREPSVTFPRGFNSKENLSGTPKLGGLTISSSFADVDANNSEEAKEEDESARRWSMDGLQRQTPTVLPRRGGLSSAFSEIDLASSTEKPPRVPNAAHRVSQEFEEELDSCLLYTSPSPRDQRGSRMPSSA